MSTTKRLRRIYAHRGLWHTKIEQNSEQAINDCIARKYGLETDLRLGSEGIVLAHSPEDLSLDPVVISKAIFSTNVALNIKEDGLLPLLVKFKEKIINSNSFVFDGSIPEMLIYKKAGIPQALRLSEYESELPWETDILWVDGFESDWWLTESSKNRFFLGKRVIIVSPEIHGRSPETTWNYILENWDNPHFEIAICTDRPQDFMARML